ncbi:fumarylacetoacetate hydrolase family protein [Chitinasiproducens palmae]|uniref:2-keto-4-pentenoate hydratase/2-oxohepta-3-ene-1,7-dioic acid hydratase (Catechol pathway) n=1 Tax=Chitinasiproducens palmae TaxID=1770053 RepID=A0A1H2PVV2_9BURK|nr:fumarylacetoacetate hydrolase family protein [Chitinasiproducens palmae]SDV50605.1 2-keto-4-pentenoate hydratase/2-oxohepta-3-ene-1,7-dioic acid hydratase (catechol pathway) [Chitinasiproducens palmae]
MRYASFLIKGEASYGIVTDRGVIDLGRRFGDRFADLQALVAADFPAEVAAAAAEPVDYPLDAIAWQVPIARPVHIWCLALNYVEHHTEVQSAGRVQELPKSPALFARASDSLVAHGAPLRHPGVSEQFDFEGELVVVIGKRGFQVAAEDAMAHVAGYTIMNEGSVRDWQFHTRQITPGKNFFRSGAVGPWIVPRSDVADVDALRIRTTLNGKTMQDDVVASMVHKIPAFIAYVSTIAPLCPGDLLATGTPSGVGFSRKPPVFMKPGDLCEITIDGIGTLANRVEADTA